MTHPSEHMLPHIDNAIALVHKRVQEKYGDQASGFAVSEFTLSGMKNYLAYPVNGTTAIHQTAPFFPEETTKVASEMAVVLGDSFLNKNKKVKHTADGTVYFFHVSSQEENVTLD